MSVPLRAERLRIDRWGRASGFDLHLPGNFLVLYGPNESGKTSAATALAWLVAGPGTQGVIQRFGEDKDVLQARLYGFLGSENLTLEARPRITGQRAGSAASENFEARLGGVALSRTEWRARLGGGEFAEYRRFYWVEALQVAQGDDLQENISIQAMFGGINPFAEANSLDDAVRADIGASAGRAAAGSARDFQGRIKSLEDKSRALPDTKSEWLRIEGELSHRQARLDEIQPELEQLSSKKRSVALATKAFADGAVAALDEAREELRITPEPSTPALGVHGRFRLLDTEIRDLEAAEGQSVSAHERYETAFAALGEDWRPLVDAGALGEAGINDVAAAEAELKVRVGDLATAKQAEAAAVSNDAACRARYGDLKKEWRDRAPKGLTPEACVAFAPDSESPDGQAGAPPATGRIDAESSSRAGWSAPSADADRAGAPYGWPGASQEAGRGGQSSGSGWDGASSGSDRAGTGAETGGRRGLRAVPTAGAALAAALAVVFGVLGNWAAVALAGVAAGVLAWVVVRALRVGEAPEETAEPPDPALVDLAMRLLRARHDHDHSARRLAEAEAEVARAAQGAEEVRESYRHSLDALGVPDELAAKSDRAVDNLHAVRAVQLAAVTWRRAEETVAARLAAVQEHLAAVTRTARGDSGERLAADYLLHDDEDAATSVPRDSHEDASGADGGVVPEAVSSAAPQDSGEARFVLDEVRRRVDAHRKAVEAEREAEGELRRALNFDDVALALVAEGDPEALASRQAGLDAEVGEFEEERSRLRGEVAELTADKKAIERPDNERVEIMLECSDLLTQVEEKLVRGLGRHLAARLLREAADEHRRTRQPGLLQRAGQLAQEVAATWRGIGVNPHASTGRGKSAQADNLLVDGPSGEYSAQQLSFGAQSLLYLALRLATIEEQSASRGVRLPLILDDVLVGIDDDRAERCVQVLANFSAAHQIILLTCHRQSAERAQSAGAQLVTIPPTI